MSLLKHAINIIVQSLGDRDIGYINDNILLQSIKNDSSANDLMFRTLMDLVLQTCYNLDQQQIIKIWDQFNYTMADFVYFAENSLIQLGYPFFISSQPIKQIKSMIFLSSKAILCAIIYILLTYYDLESKVKSTVETSPNINKNNKYEVVHPSYNNKVLKGAKNEQSSIQILQVLYNQQKQLIRQISEQIPQYNNQSQETPSAILVTFLHKFLNKMLTEVKSEQLQRASLEKYDVSNIEKSPEQTEANDLAQANYKHLNKHSVQNIQNLRNEINSIISWIKEEFWME